MDDDPLDKHRGTTPRPRTRLWFLLALFFGILVTIGFGILSELIFSSDSTTISDGIFKNPQVYTINTECELLVAILNDEFNVPMTELSKRFPDEANEGQRIVDEIQTNDGNATPEQQSRLLELIFQMMSKYYSINPDLKDTFYYLTEHPRDSLAWVDRIDPIFTKCDLTLR